MTSPMAGARGTGSDVVYCDLAEGFTMIPNTVLRSPELSTKAKVVLCLLLSNKQGWHSFSTVMTGFLKEGIYTVRAGVRELEKLGYLARLKYKTRSSQFAGMLWCVTSTPGQFDGDSVQNAAHRLEEQGFIVTGFTGSLVYENGTVQYNTGYCFSVSCPTGDGGTGDGEPKANNTNDKNTNEKNTQRSLSERVPRMKRTKHVSSAPVKPSPVERARAFLPLAETLAAIVKSGRNVTITPGQITSWTNEFRRLHEQAGIEVSRMEKALEWYREHARDQYVPVIASGFAFRDKFLRLEDAMVRDTAYADRDTGSGSKVDDAPDILSDEDLLTQMTTHLGNKTTARLFRDKVYAPAWILLMRHRANTSSRMLLKVLLQLHKDVSDAREAHLSEDLQLSLPGATTILGDYVQWLGSSDWIQNITTKVFNVQSPLFSRFRRVEADVDPLARDPLTGVSYKGGDA